MQINKKTGYHEIYWAWDQASPNECGVDSTVQDSLRRTGPQAGTTLPNPEDSKSEVKLTAAV